MPVLAILALGLILLVVAGVVAFNVTLLVVGAVNARKARRRKAEEARRDELLEARIREARAALYDLLVKEGVEAVLHELTSRILYRRKGDDGTIDDRIASEASHILKEHPYHGPLGPVVAMVDFCESPASREAIEKILCERPDDAMPPVAERIRDRNRTGGLISVARFVGDLPPVIQQHPAMPPDCRELIRQVEELRGRAEEAARREAEGRESERRALEHLLEEQSLLDQYRQLEQSRRSNRSGAKPGT